MSEAKDPVPATEIRIVAADLNHHGKPDTLTIEFYKEGKLVYAVETAERHLAGFMELKSAGYDQIENDKLIELANIALHLH